MGKPKSERRLADNEAMAMVRNIRISPQKLNLLAQSIRGKRVEKALADLTFSRKRIAKDVTGAAGRANDLAAHGASLSASVQPRDRLRRPAIRAALE